MGGPSRPYGVPAAEKVFGSTKSSMGREPISLPSAAATLPERRAVGLTDTVAKAAAGAVEYVPIARVTNLVRLIEQLKERNIWVVGAAAEATQLYTDWDWRLPNARSRYTTEQCAYGTRIPG